MRELGRLQSPKGETMTGAYLRIKRNGEWQKIEVEYLTDAEREEFMKDDTRLINWLNMVCNTLTEVEKIIKAANEKLSFLPEKQP